MRLDFTVVFLTLLSSAAAAVVEPPRLAERIDSVAQSDDHELYKRRGGGGGGSRGGGGFSSGGGSKSSSGRSHSSSSQSSKHSFHLGSSSKSSSSKSSSSKSSSSKSSSSKSGTGTSRGFGGGRYYPGGAAAPYTAGRKSSKGLVPALVLGSALLFWPGVWLHGAYTYDYPQKYTFHNATTNKNETLPVKCACARYEKCGCDENTDNSYLNSLVGNGSYAALNKSVVNVGKYHNKKTLLINGTLSNDTSAPSASLAGDGMSGMVKALGYWPAVVAAVAAVYVL